MVSRLRICLAVLMAGFAVEGGGEAYSLLTAGAFVPGASVVFLVPIVVTVLGILFLFVGRSEWEEFEGTRLRRLNLIFGLTVLTAVIAAIELTLLATFTEVGSPPWAAALFGSAVGALVLGAFATWAQLVYHLVSAVGKALLIASIAGALVVSSLIGYVLAGDLPTILGLIGAHSFSIGSLVGPVDNLLSYLFVSYFLLLIAYGDAFRAVARRRRVARPGSSRQAAPPHQPVPP